MEPSKTGWNTTTPRANSLSATFPRVIKTTSARWSRRGTSDRLSRETGHQVCYMPEFLTERTHIEDFKKQTMVFTGAHELLTKIYKNLNKK